MTTSIASITLRKTDNGIHIASVQHYGRELPREYAIKTQELGKWFEEHAKSIITPNDLHDKMIKEEEDALPELPAIVEKPKVKDAKKEVKVARSYDDTL